MPPKPKFTREQVLQAALTIVKTEGEDALTARRLGEELGSSPRPIFTLFESMDEVKSALIPLVDQVFYDYCAGFDHYKPAYKKIGVSIVSFSEEEPHLFSYLFMSKHSESLTLDGWVKSRIGEEAVAILMRDYGFDEPLARSFHKEMWLHSFSLCVLRAGDIVDLSMQEVSDSLTRAFMSLYSVAKSGRFQEHGVRPVLDAPGGDFDIRQVPTVEFADPAEMEG